MFGCSSVDDAALDESLEASGVEDVRLLFSQNFNRYTSSELYTQAKARRDFGTIATKSAAKLRGLDSDTQKWPQKTRVIDGVLRAQYLKDIAGGDHGGFQFDRPFAGVEEATMEYRVKFGKNLVWRYGGKLPGLGGTSLSSGIPAGCTQDRARVDNGFSTRLMWRQSGGSGPARLVAYTYFPDRDTSKCGVDITFIRGIEKDKWYTLRQYVKLNTPGQRNGVLKMYVDGKLMLEKNDILYRKAGKGNVKINSAVMQTYRGGGATDPRWISPTTDYIYFDDFKVWAGEVGSGGGGGNGNYTIRVRARGKSGSERIRVRLNGKNLATFNLKQGWNTFTTRTSEFGNLYVDFVNDNGEGRDAYVDWLSVNGNRRQAEAQRGNTAAWGNGRCGGGSFTQEMTCNGYINFGGVAKDER